MYTVNILTLEPGITRSVWPQAEPQWPCDIVIQNKKYIFKKKISDFFGLIQKFSQGCMKTSRKRITQEVLFLPPDLFENITSIF